MKHHRIILLLATVLLGCSSFSSTLLHRTEDNCAWKQERMLHGVPITLKVPTHVRVDVAEKHFLVLDQVQRKRRDGSTVTVQAIHRKAAKFPLREVTYHMIETEKVFVVDLKRPGAGTIDAKLDFDADDQYFDEIKTKVVDETIEQVGNLIAQVAPSGLFGAPTADTAGEKVSNRIKQVFTVVASNIFEIDAPDFEFQLRAFLDRHLNCCHDCGLLPVDTAPPVELPAPAVYPRADRNGESITSASVLGF
jgi:hypothetical protein